MAVKSYFLDTNIFIHYARGNKIAKWIESEFSLQKASNRPLTSTIVRGEVLAFAERRKWGQQKRNILEDMFRNCILINIDHESIARTYAEVMEFSMQGVKFGKSNQNDGWIAATCSVARAHLLTTDNDFRHLSPKFFVQSYIDQEAIHKGRI